VTVGGLNQVKVFRTDDFSQVATIPVGNLPHGLWPSGDGSRIYVGLENADAMTAIDTLSNKVIATVPIGQAPQAVTYVPNAVPQGDGKANTQPLGLAGQTTQLALVPVGSSKPVDPANAPTTVALFDQGLLQVLQAAVTGLQPKQPYVLGLADNPDGSGNVEALANFMTNSAGSAIVNALGQIRQLVTPGMSTAGDKHRYLVIAPQVSGKPGTPVQVQSP
jgi:YVTN family beta-propeller protein